jgi:hypothetical protein
MQVGKGMALRGKWRPLGDNYLLRLETADVSEQL